MTYTLGQAAKATGRNKATIFQALKSGKISGHKDDMGRYVIDPAELHRVYPPVSRNGENGEAAQREQTPDNGEETRFYKEKVVLLERLVEQITGERDRLLLLLPKPPEAPPVVYAPPPPAEPEPDKYASLLERLDAIERGGATVAASEKTAPAPAPSRGMFGWFRERQVSRG